MKKLFTTLFTIIIIGQSFAQNSVEGFVLDEKNKPIYFATVAIYSTPDSLYVDAVSTEEDGSFSFKNLEAASYYINIDMIGYEENRVAISLPLSGPVDIKLEPNINLLNTVEIKAKVPLLEQKPDRLVVNVENNLTGLNGNVLTVLKKVPGLLVLGDQVRMAGQSNMTILINGKTTQYMDVQSLLKDMPADNIKKVEVIHQPGAEFDAEGTGPILNIILKKNNLFGTNGTLRAGVAKGEDWKYTTGLNLSHYQGKTSIQGGVGYKNYPWYDLNEITRNINDTIYNQTSVDPGWGSSYRLNFSMDHAFNDKHEVGFQSRFIDWTGDNQITTDATVDYKTEEKQNLSLFTDNSSDEIWRLFTISPYYTINIDTTGQKLEADFTYSRIQNDGTTTLTTEEIIQQFTFPRQQYVQPGLSDIYTSKLDYTLPINKAFTVKAGAKLSIANLDNDLQAYNEQDGEFVLDENTSNHFLFDENIYAAYTKLDYQVGEFSGTAGLRYEESHSLGTSLTINQSIPRDISKFFPSFSIARDIVSGFSSSIAYSYRINRPRYSNLNPFVYYLDAFTFSAGNPMLSPAYAHSVKFNLMYEKTPFFNVEYKDVTDAMVELTAQNDGTGETNLVTVNLESYKNYNMTLYFPLDFIPETSGYGGVIANNNIYKSEYLGAELDRQRWDFTGFIQAEWSFPYDVTAELSGWYWSGGIEGIIQTEDIFGTDAGVSKKFLDGDLTLNVGVENFLAKYMVANINYLNMDLRAFNRWDGPVYSFEMSYKFGNQHMKTNNKKSTSADDILNRAQKS